MVKTPQKNSDGTPGNSTTADAIVSGPGFGLTGLV